MKSAEKRKKEYIPIDVEIEAFKRRIDAETIAKKFEAKKELLAEGQVRWKRLFEPIYTEVKKLMDENGIFGPLRLTYRNFTIKLVSAYTKYTGKMLETEIKAIREYFKFMVLSPELLDDIIKIVQDYFRKNYGQLLVYKKWKENKRLRTW